MDVLQGRYLKKIESKSGQLKGLKVETTEGVQTIYLPKSLREIALQELAIGDRVRIWLEVASEQGKKSKPKQRYATGLIPLSPKLKLSQLKSNERDGIDTSSKGANSKKAKSKQEKPKKDKTKKAEAKAKSEKAKTKKTKTKKAKLITVQLCQKKNCCKKGGSALWQTFEGWQQSAKDQAVPFQLEAVGCLGGCKRGPNIRFLPKNVKHYHVQPDEVAGLLKKYRV